MKKILFAIVIMSLFVLSCAPSNELSSSQIWSLCDTFVDKVAPCYENVTDASEECLKPIIEEFIVSNGLTKEEWSTIMQSNACATQLIRVLDETEEKNSKVGDRIEVNGINTYVCQYNIDCKERIMISKWCDPAEFRDCECENILGTIICARTIPLSWAACHEGYCIECENDEDCRYNKYCSQDTFECVECLEDSHCIGSYREKYCDLNRKECEECTKDAHCSSGEVCREVPKYPDSDTLSHILTNKCVECMQDSDCPTGYICYENRCEN